MTAAAQDEASGPPPPTTGQESPGPSEPNAEEEKEAAEAAAEKKEVVPAIDSRVSSIPIVRKYAEQLKEAEWSRSTIAHHTRLQETLLKEQEVAKQELESEKARLGKMESLAKELRRRKDEELDRLKKADLQEQEQRKALSERFQQTISDVTKRMDADAEEQVEVVARNKQLRSRLSVLGQQVELKTAQFEQLLKTKDMELRLAEARAAHMTEMASGERLKMEAQTKQLETESKDEVELTGQLRLLKEKFDGLQATIIKSNDVFRDYKAEMERMTKRIKHLESERGTVLKRYATKKRATEDMERELQAQEKKHEQLTRTGETMQGLIAVLRQEAEDFEAWKQACPEEYAAILKELPEEAPAAAEAGGQQRKKKK
eukprot:TRINITY_DN2423_c0_g2_i2.p1 TRINITY_DN2423_c0_g2~~TRINITY_DN2423_c0_g2_i2.p1  ORF type:complete len:374 (+),score=172.77 TRINITY_DN2423_c0_g2_i2:73-1194(+)